MKTEVDTKLQHRVLAELEWDPSVDVKLRPTRGRSLWGLDLRHKTTGSPNVYAWTQPRLVWRPQTGS
jgi:hypothetical protein